MGFRHLCRSAAVGALLASTLATGSAPAASAGPCPDAEIVFARGSGEPPGLGTVGEAFVNAVRARLPGKSVGAYPVNYPATPNFDDKSVFPSTMFDGVHDADAHLQAMAANCPNTKLLLGGYSQGAAVAAYVTTSDVARDINERTAGIVVFGRPTAELLGKYGAPAANISPVYTGKSLDLCAQGDSICDGSPGSLFSSLVHALYPLNGMVDGAASSAAGRLA